MWGGVVFLVGFLLLQGLDVQIPADLCRDLFAMRPAPPPMMSISLPKVKLRSFFAEMRARE